MYDISLNWNTNCLIPKTHLTKNDDFYLNPTEPRPPEYFRDDSIPDPIDIPMPLSKSVSP